MLLCNSISEKRICQYRFVGVRVVEKGRVCGCTSLLGQESVIKMY